MKEVEVSEVSMHLRKCLGTCLSFDDLIIDFERAPYLSSIVSSIFSDLFRICDIAFVFNVHIVTSFLSKSKCRHISRAASSGASLPMSPLYIEDVCIDKRDDLFHLG